MAISYRLGDYLLAMQGLAILRSWGIDPAAVHDRVEEIAGIFNGLSDGPYGATAVLPEYEVAEGYRTWAETYDTVPNILVEVEEGVVHPLLDSIEPKLPRNGLVGIRTPWTLADPAVWERTHRLGGYLVTAAGLVSLASLPATGKRAMRLPLAASLGAVVLSAAYSFVAYTRRARFSR